MYLKSKELKQKILSNLHPYHILTLNKSQGNARRIRLQPQPPTDLQKVKEELEVKRESKGRFKLVYFFYIHVPIKSG